MNLYKFVTMILVFMSVSSFSIAFEDDERAPASASDLAKEVEISKLAKTKTYKGGQDEEDLRVQPNLFSPTRKIAPTNQANPEQSVEEVEQE